MTLTIVKHTFISLHITVPSSVTANVESQRLWMINGFLLMIFYASIQSLWPLNSYLRYVQGRLVLFPEIFKNGKNVVSVKTENTLVTYVQFTLLLYLLIFYIYLYYFIIVILTSVGR